MAYPPESPGDHAEDFGRRYREEIEIAVGQILLDLGIPAARIGSGDREYGIEHSVFHPHRRDGGGVTPDGRINLDSGLMNPELLDAAYGEEAGRIYRRTRFRARVEAIATHEEEEHRGGSHDHAVTHAPETELPISLEARALLRAMRGGWKPLQPGQ